VSKIWLLKTEPDTFSIEDLQACPDGTSGWDGVRNYQARNRLRDEMDNGRREEMATVEQLARLFYPLMPLSTRILQRNLGETLVDGFARGLTLGQCKRRWRGASIVGR